MGELAARLVGVVDVVFKVYMATRLCYGLQQCIKRCAAANNGQRLVSKLMYYPQRVKKA